MSKDIEPGFLCSREPSLREIYTIRRVWKRTMIQAATDSELHFFSSFMLRLGEAFVVQELMVQLPGEVVLRPQ